MAKRTRRCIRLAALLVALGVPADLLASCMVPGPPCEVFWRTPVVFAGKVISITYLSDNSYGPKRVRFLITEAFRGPEPGEVDIHLRGGSNDPDFAEGDEWMIYAHHRTDGPGWTTSICGRTARLADAQADLEYARLSDDAKGHSRVFGRVVRQDVEISNPQRRYMEVPLPDVAVVITGANETHHTKTRPDGSYEFRVPSQRAFRVSFEYPRGLVPHGGSEIFIPSHRGCAVVNGYARHDGRVTGTVRDARGMPVPYLPLMLQTVREGLMGRYEMKTLTRGDGTFEFEQVQPEFYRVFVDEALGDVSARPLTPVLTMDPARRIDAGGLVLPASSRAALLEGILLASDDTPAQDVSLYIQDVDVRTSGISGVRTDAHGRFSLTVVAGRRYRIVGGRSRAEGAEQIGESIKEVVTAIGMKPVTLRLKRSE